MEFLLWFNISGIGLFLLLVVLRLFGTSNRFLLAGDFNLLLIILLSLFFLKNDKPAAAAGTIYLLPVSILCYHVIENYYLAIPITADSLFASLAFLIFGIMFIGAFAIRQWQIIVYGFISIVTLLTHFIVMVNTPGGAPADHDSYTLLFAAILNVMAALLAAFLTRKISSELIAVSESSHQKTANKYLSLFSNMMDGFSLQRIILDAEGNATNSIFLEVNSAFERFVGLPRDQIIGRYASDIVPGITDSAGKWLGTFAKVAASGKEARIEDFSNHFGRWLDVYSFCPEPGYFVTLFRDITESKKTEDALRVSEQRNKAIINALPDTIFIIDETGNIQELISDTGAESGQNAVEKPDRNSGPDFPDETLNRLIASARLALSAHTVQTIEYELPNSEHTQFYEARLLALDSTQVMVINRNIDDRKEAEIRLLKAKARAEESDRLKTAFLANMSHEVLTPMNAIMGFSQMLDDESISESERKDFAGLIRTSGEQLIQLINDIMDLARIEAGETTFKTTQFELKPLFNELKEYYIAGMQRSGKTGIELVADVERLADGETIEGDRDRLKQVMGNLIDNAVKFTHKGFIRFGCTQTDPGIYRFYVADSGIGIPEDKQKIIFERFRQVEEDYNRTYGGTGIGLALVTKLIELMGGQITLVSEYGRGSEFSFSLKAETLSDTPRYIIPVSGPVLNRNYDWSGKTILVTEDIQTNFVFLQRLLNNLNVEVLQALNGRQAVELVSSGRHIDLILMDMQMPEMNGLDAFREIRKISPGIKIILQTAYAGKNEQETYREMGFDGFIAKPIRIGALLMLIDATLHPQAGGKQK